MKNKEYYLQQVKEIKEFRSELAKEELGKTKPLGNDDTSIVSKEDLKSQENPKSRLFKVYL